MKGEQGEPGRQGVQGEPGEDGTSLSISDLSSVIRHVNKQRNTIYVLATLAMIAAIAFAVVTFILIGTIDQVRTISQRQDCSREYSAIIAHADRQLAINGWIQTDRLGNALYNSVANHQTVTPSQVTDFGLGSTALHQAVNDVTYLPNIDDAVNKGFKLNGNSYPACPSL